MPTPNEILEGLTHIAREGWPLAVVWHGLLGALVIALVAGWRPDRRLFGALLAAPLASASLVAWLAGNPFNGVVIGFLGAGALVAALRAPGHRLRFGGPIQVFSGAVLVTFGWVYPHFLEPGTLLGYLYAAPLGLIPCPTLSVVVGFGLLTDGLGSRPWSLILAGAGMLYGLFGALQLGVLMDAVLLVGAVGLAVVAMVTAPELDEADGQLPGS